MSSYLFNSFVVTFFIVAGQLVTSICAGYAFAFLRLPVQAHDLRRVPGDDDGAVRGRVLHQPADRREHRTLPLVGRFLGLDTYGALVVPFLATGFGAFLVRQAFLSLPRDLRDAAELDGYGHFRFMWRVAVPLARPTIAALALFSFFDAWNQYLWPLVVTDHYRTVQVGLRQLSRVSLDQINVTFAGTVLAALPLLILLLVFQKQLVRGLTAGAVKG